MEIQDHYVLIEEPQSVFLGHVVPFSGHGISLAVAIHRYLKKRNWDKRPRRSLAVMEQIRTLGDSKVVFHTWKNSLAMLSIALGGLSSSWQ